MVKRLTSIALIVFVLLGTLGVSYDAHYCQGRLIKEQYSFYPAKLGCGMKHKDSKQTDTESVSKVCCENDHSYYELSDDFDVNDALKLHILNDITLPEIETEFLSELKLVSHTFIGYSPPPYEGRDLYLKNQSLII